MRKKYYCDYCCKRLKDDVNIKKKHIAGLPHQKAKIEHYAKFKDLKTILLEEIGKLPCHKYQQNNCKFGSSCRFSHYTRNQLWELQNEIDRRNVLNINKQTRNNKQIFDYFLLNRKDTNVSKNTNIIKSIWKYSDRIHNNYLPPSLQIIDVNNIAKFSEWGEC